MSSKLRVVSPHITVSVKQLERFLRFRAFVFHLLTFFWHAYLNYHAGTRIYGLFQTRMDIVSQTYGGGLQYITVWNQLIQQTYFNFCLLQDILEFTPPDKHLKVKEFLRNKLPYAFSTVVLPLSFLVLVNFWAIYPFNRQIIDEFDVTASFFPMWINHALHTSIVLLVCLEKVVVHRTYPTMVGGLAGVCSVVWAYVFTCAALHFLSGMWPYPLFKIMSNIQRLTFITFNCLLGFFVFVIGSKINRKIWGHARGHVMDSSAKKVS